VLGAVVKESMLDSMLFDYNILLQKLNA